MHESSRRRVYTTEKIGSGRVKKVVRTHNVCQEILEFLQGHRRLWPCGNSSISLQKFWVRTVRVRKWSQDRKWSRTANDPQIGPQMIPDRKWSPYWTANDPDQKIRNAMDGRIGWIGNWCTWIPIFFSLCLNARQPGKVLNGLNART